MTLQFAGMTSWSIFLTFCFSCQISGPNLMSISSHVLEFWQFSFIKDWPEIWKSEIPPSEFCPISRDWGKLGTPKLARISLIKCYWMLQNPRVTTFTVSELPGENQRGWGGVNYPPPPLRLGSILEAKFGDDPVAVDMVYVMLLNRLRRNLWNT